MKTIILTKEQTNLLKELLNGRISKIVQEIERYDTELPDDGVTRMLTSDCVSELDSVVAIQRQLLGD